jgi:peptidoglycan-associated lipoprotein
MKKTVLCIMVAVAAAACSSNEKKETPASVGDRSTGVQQPQSGMSSSTTQQQQPMGNVSGNPLNDPNSPLSKRSVYFDFDSNAVKDEYRGLVQAHSRYLTTDKRDSRIRIEGNCDERGSREYNLALGQRRAEAAKKYLDQLGVKNQQITAISFGAEKPKANGHDEEAWKQNRRDDVNAQK